MRVTSDTCELCDTRETTSVLVEGELLWVCWPCARAICPLGPWRSARYDPRYSANNDIPRDYDPATMTYANGDTRAARLAKGKP